MQDTLNEESETRMNRFKTIGILGGMGPMAAYDLGMKILTNTEASCDQENIPVILDNNTRIADRTAAILSGGEDPADEMIKNRGTKIIF